MTRSGRPPRNDKTNTADVGWRLQQLRLRRGLRQNELAELAGLDPGYLNRLGNGTSRKANPKPDTVNKILDALAATKEERSAVFHIEPSPLTRAEIDSVVAEIRANYEDSPQPVTLIDHHWVRWYHNRTMRLVLSLTDKEYERTMGEMPLVSLIDPTSPTYQRIPEDEREMAFAVRSQVFRRQFAGQEFDSWYLQIVANIRRYPRAAKIWENPPATTQQFLDSHLAGIYCPALCRKLQFKTQLNRLMKDPRFVMVELTSIDEETERLVDLLRSMPAGFNLPPPEPPGRKLATETETQ